MTKAEEKSKNRKRRLGQLLNLVGQTREEYTHYLLGMLQEKGKIQAFKTSGSLDRQGVDFRIILGKKGRVDIDVKSSILAVSHSLCKKKHMTEGVNRVLFYIPNFGNSPKTEMERLLSLMKNHRTGSS